jgi:methyltransferase (TIGR00027 family)
MELPARTSILVAAARAFGSREPDETIRNPDFLADKLIGQDELALISGHPLSAAMLQPYAEAIQNSAVAGLTFAMLLRTRFIDEAITRAVNNGATQIIILGAGFDSRAYRFRDLLAAPTQQYKKARVHAVLSDLPTNLTYLSVDFLKDDLRIALRAAGLRETEKTFYIWEGVTMYLPEESVRKTLQLVAACSAPGSSLVLDYVSSLGLDLAKANPQGPGSFPTAWGEPWIFGVPVASSIEFFRKLGLDPGVPVAMTNPELIKRYAIGRDGTMYGAKVFAKMRAEAQTRPGSEDARKAVAAAGGVYWLAELTVPDSAAESVQNG